MTTTIMNTGAASLSDEQRTTIQHAADKLRTVWANHTGDKESRELCHKLEAILATTPQADAAPSEEAYVAKRLSEALADVYMTIIGDDEPEADDGSNVIERVKKAAQVLRLEVDLYRSQADAAIAAGGAAQEVAGYQGTHDGKWVEFTREMFDLAGGDSNPFVRKVYAAPLPRVAATVALTDDNELACSSCGLTMGQSRRLAASNGEQEVRS